MNYKIDKTKRNRSDFVKQLNQITTHPRRYIRASPVIPLFKLETYLKLDIGTMAYNNVKSTYDQKLLILISAIFEIKSTFP